MGLYSHQHESLFVVEKMGMEKPELQGNTLTIYTNFQSYDWYQRGEISYAENFVQVAIRRFNEYRTYYYVYDYGAWNLRYYKDSSVKYHLEKNDAKFVKFLERHSFTFDFGRSKDGKSALEVFLADCHKKLPIVNDREDGSLLTERPWNQELDILLKSSVTKATFHLTSETIDLLVDLVDKSGYPQQADELKKYRAKAMFKKMDGIIDFKPVFSKKKKK